MTNPLEHSDLVAKIKTGDPKSLELLFRRMYPRLCAYARKFLQDTNDAEEVVQELFYSIWKNRDRLDESKSFNSYLFISIKNSCLNTLQSRKSKSKHAELMQWLYTQEGGTVDSYHALLANDLERDFNLALEHLPTECRKIFELSRTEGLKYQEIARELNISIKTVETQMSRALSKLRIQLRQHIAAVLLIIFFN
jgi:RNA polymerase sigma-70 factor, ECF subfamily